VSLLPVRGLLGPVNALDELESLGERREGELNEPFFSCDGSNVEAGGSVVEGSNARSRSSNAGKRCSTERSTLGAFD
jgi:hypothetical protein